MLTEVLGERILFFRRWPCYLGRWHVASVDDHSLYRGASMTLLTLSKLFANDGTLLCTICRYLKPSRLSFHPCSQRIVKGVNVNDNQNITINIM